jgi:hypothetical protein
MLQLLSRGAGAANQDIQFDNCVDTDRKGPGANLKARNLHDVQNWVFFEIMFRINICLALQYRYDDVKVGAQRDCIQCNLII